MEEAVGGKEMNINKKERTKIGVGMNSEYKHAHMLTMNYDEFKYWLGKEYDAILIWEFAKDLFNGNFTEDPAEYTTGEAYSKWLEKKMTEVYDDLEGTGFHNMGELWICLMKG